MIFTSSGVPLQGITGGFDGDRRVEFILDKTKREFSFVIESSCNGMFGISGIAPPDVSYYLKFVKFMLNKYCSKTDTSP